MQKAYGNCRRFERCAKQPVAKIWKTKLTSEAEDALGSGDDGDDDDDDDDQGDDDNRDDRSAAGFWKVKCQQKVFVVGKCAASW